MHSCVLKVPLLISVPHAGDTVAAAPVITPIGEPFLDKAKTSMAAARKLHTRALDYFNHPDHAMQHAVWKSKGDNKLQRAASYYGKKREALVHAYGDAGLPAEMSRLYPPVG